MVHALNRLEMPDMQTKFFLMPTGIPGQSHCNSHIMHEDKESPIVGHRHSSHIFRSKKLRDAVIKTLSFLNALWYTFVLTLSSYFLT